MGRQSRRKHASKPPDYARLFDRAMRAEEAADSHARACSYCEDDRRRVLEAFGRIRAVLADDPHPRPSVAAMFRTVEALIHEGEWATATSCLLLMGLRGWGRERDATNALIALASLLHAAGEMTEAEGPG